MVRHASLFLEADYAEIQGADSLADFTEGAMSFHNDVAPIGKDDLPRDLYDAYMNARFYVLVPLRLIHLIRDNEVDVWIPAALKMADMIGRELKSRNSGRTFLTPTLLAEFAGLGRQFSDFGVHASSAHEWSPMFAREVIAQVWDGMTQADRGKPGRELTWMLYFNGSTENPLSTRSVRATAGSLDDTLKKHAAAIKEYISGLALPNEQLVYAHLKSEACMAAARRPKSELERIRFDDDSRTVNVDGRSHQVSDPTAYAMFKAVAEARPHRITSREIAVLPGLSGKNIARELKKLPRVLRKMIDSKTNGHCCTLPATKLS